jgi:hypothetical protein
MLSKVSYNRPPTIHFPRYTKDETVQIICNSAPADIPFKNLYQPFVTILCATYYNACRDLTDLMYLVEHIYPKYVEPIQKGVIEESQTTKLFSLIQTRLRTTLESLYLRELSSFDWKSNNFKGIMY